MFLIPHKKCQVKKTKQMNQYIMKEKKGFIFVKLYV